MNLETKLKIAGRFTDGKYDADLPLTKVFITGEAIFATDRFKMVEIKRDVEGEGDITGTGITVNDPAMPDYKKVMPQGTPVLSFKLQTALLKSVLDAMKLGKKKLITIDLYGENEPIKVTSEDGEVVSLVMPIRK